MNKLRDNTGFTLIEVLLASTLMIVVLGATLTALSQFETTNRLNERQNDAQDHARLATDRMARELRNLASPTNTLPDAVLRNDPYDFLFQAFGNSGPTKRIRYCLTSGSPAQLYRQEQTPGAGPLPDSVCPDLAWGDRREVASAVMNRAGDRSLFLYNATDPHDITSVRNEVYVDVDPSKKPSETRLASGVFLRNQNRKPVATFTTTLNGSSVVLNGSGSTDPEGKLLTYIWKEGDTKLGEGIVFTCCPSSPLSPGSHDITLEVTDPAELTSTSTEAVVFP